MDARTIYKDPSQAVQFNLTDYRHTYQQFDWSDARARVKGLGDELNIAHEAVDRHVDEGYGDQIALRWLGKKGQQRNISYGELGRMTGQFAAILAQFQVHRADVVFGLCNRVPPLYYALLGTLKYGAVFSPLFSAFGPQPVRARMEIGHAKVLVTSEALYRKKVMPWRDELPSLSLVLLYDTSSEPPPGCQDLDQLMAADPDPLPATPCQPDELALLHFTSGTTGKPKGAMHVHEAVIHHKHSGFYALDLRPGDIYWCTADPGWVTGTSYGIISPLCNRATLIIDEQEFDPVRWYQLLADERVNIWYTAPTAIRMLMKAGDDLPGQVNLSALRFMASVGEPLNPEAVLWSQRVFGQPFHDNWWQSETGGIMIANFASEPIRPGSMGRPLPGIQAAVVKRQDDGTVQVIDEPGVIGELAVQRGWPSMFRGYLNEQARYQKCFAGDWYISGDLAMRDADGFFWFVGRADDLIKSAGHLIGPFEVESALLEHPAVAEAGVIGIPDEMAGEVVKAFVALKPGFEANDDLLKSLMGHARKKLGPAVAPRMIAIQSDLPKTRSGKIMRRLLKARALGLPEGDTSTLEKSGE